MRHEPRPPPVSSLPHERPAVGRRPEPAPSTLRPCGAPTSAPPATDLPCSRLASGRPEPVTDAAASPRRARHSPRPVPPAPGGPPALDRGVSVGRRPASPPGPRRRRRQGSAVTREHGLLGGPEPTARASRLTTPRPGRSPRTAATARRKAAASAGASVTVARRLGAAVSAMAAASGDRVTRPCASTDWPWPLGPRCPGAVTWARASPWRHASPAGQRRPKPSPARTDPRDVPTPPVATVGGATFASEPVVTVTSEAVHPGIRLTRMVGSTSSAPFTVRGWLRSGSWFRLGLPTARHRAREALFEQLPREIGRAHV